MKILIVEESKNIATILSKLLKMKGHECIISYDGKNGLILLQEETIDATILDLSLSDFSAIDFIKSLEKSGNLEKQNIIILNQFLSNEQIEELKKPGIYACLQKPVTVDLLLQTLVNLTQFRTRRRPSIILTK